MKVPRPEFRHAASRARYEQQYQRLKESAAGLSTGDLARLFLELEAQLDAGLSEVKTVMLTSGLFSNEDDQALGFWIFQHHANLWLLGVAATQRCASDAGFDVSRTLRLIALTMLHGGEATKWELMVGRHERRPYETMHSLLKMAVDLGRQHENIDLVVDGLRRSSSIEGLYLHALVLDRYTSGKLTRPQVEVLDAWLWEKDLVATSRFPGGPALRVDLDSNAGLRFGRRKDSGPSLYLEIAPLEARRRAIMKEFHAGRVVPTRGLAANIRIEAHVAVLHALRTLLSIGGIEGLPPRAPRHEAANTKVEALIGLKEIAADLRPAELVVAGSKMELSLQAATGSARQAKLDSMYDKPRHLFTLRNSSATGFLVEAMPKDVANVFVGDLIGLRMNPPEPPILVRVQRRVQVAGEGTVRLGLMLISDPGRPVKLAALVTEDGTKHTFVFVPGPDGSGRYDSFALPFSSLLPDARYELRVGGDVFTVVFNRVRRRGRGWGLAGFEIVEGMQALAA